MQTGTVNPKELPYYTDVIYVCPFPTHHAEIKKMPARSKGFPPLAITGVTFDICKESVRVVAETRVKRLEAELEAAKIHLANVLALKESDVK